MRPKTEEVLAGLKVHAASHQRSLRASELASKLGLPSKIVSNALNWLVVDGKHPNVRRERDGKAVWYRYYWWGEDGL